MSARAKSAPPEPAGSAPPAGDLSSEADQTFVAHHVMPTVAELLSEEHLRWKENDAPWSDPVDALQEFVGGGKGLRPRFCYWGHAAVSGRGANDLVVRAGAALELLHAFALIHDDLMDASSMRRGRPALSRVVTDTHRQHGWAGDPRRYGQATAMLTGDLAFGLACRLAAELPAATREVWNALITTLTAGQFLDLNGAARSDRSIDTARTVAGLKSGHYTVTGPMALGAAIAGRDLPQRLARFGDLVGEAFQLRDDLLGVFGDDAQTGKPVGDDLREGKPTLLLAHARSAATPDQLRMLDLIGRPDLAPADIDLLTRILNVCGARARVEQQIDTNLRRAAELLDELNLSPEVRAGLHRLAINAGRRSV
ncbi:polyprenyl synthetase family protein [Actinocatenispora comari]|uniref:Geranylgeranyl pyrophosphate synthase n=1 Tax=Actinocatenispora comari TaxID=2807577 RepID=A0A8J4ERJ7_9ACTN|nr:polyprenyl synthetase family protein [Actinocatenispora comari]GIL30939.1 geranylgeranyl pyrophosphate synthase [Actinocatenispora comari]